MSFSELVGLVVALVVSSATILLTNLATGLVVLGVIINFWKWVDTRNREIKEKRHSKYMELINLAVGKCPDGRQPMMPEEIAAVWFLLEYKEYYSITSKVFSDDNVRNNQTVPAWNEQIRPAVDSLLEKISRRQGSFVDKN
jgi:hypothetical protein